MTQQALAPDTQTPAADSGSPADGGEAITDFDSLVSSYLDGEPDGDEEVPGEEDPGTQDGGDDTPEGTPDPDADELETPGADDEGDEEVPGADEEGDEDDGADPEEEDEELEALLQATEDGDDESPPAKADKKKAKADADDESFLPKFDREKLLKEHPELELSYKHMQRAFTKRQMEAARREEAAAAREAEATEAVNNQQRFLDQLKDNDFFKDFLVQAALNRPEVVETAMEEVLALNEDEGKKKSFQDKKDLEAREQKLKEREEREARTAHQQRVRSVIDLTKRAAGRLGLTSEADLEVADQYVANKILSNKAANNGKAAITNEEVVMAVRAAARAISAAREDARGKEGRAASKRNLDAAKARAKQPKRPAPPKGGSAPLPKKTPELKKSHPRQSDLDAFIDERLGVNE